MLKYLLITIGSISLFLGVVGIFLPLLPTTPFLLLTAYCYLKSSDKLYNRLLENKYLGKYIKNYYEDKGIPLKTKIYALISLWFSILLCVIFILNHLYLRLIVLIVASIVSLYILKQKTIE